MEEVKAENRKLWEVMQTLMSNQTKLEHQYNELKSQVSGSQTCPSIETSPRAGTVSPRAGTVARQHLQELNDDNQESASHSNKRHGAEHEIICSNGSELRSKFCSSISQITVNTSETPRPRRSTSKSDKLDVERLNKGQVLSQNLAENKAARRKVCKEKPMEPTSSRLVQSQPSNIHITTS